MFSPLNTGAEIIDLCSLNTVQKHGVSREMKNTPENSNFLYICKFHFFLCFILMYLLKSEMKIFYNSIL